MSWRILSLTVLVPLSAIAATAEVEVTIGDQPIEMGQRGTPAPESSDRLSSRPEGEVALKEGAESTSTIYRVPHFRVDAGYGDTTLIAVRNESNQSNRVRIDIYGSHGDEESLFKNLSPKQVWSVNLRDKVGAFTADSDGYRRGWARAESRDFRSISFDWFQVNPDQNFAVGGTGKNVYDDCYTWRVRSLIGGAFSGGTDIIFSVSPSNCRVSGNVYSEDGSFANSFGFTSPGNSYTVDASTLTNTAFSSIDIDLSRCGAPGGWVGAVHDAEGRYSVGVDGICLD